MAKPKKKAPGGPGQAFKIVYRTLVVLSAIVVALFIVWKVTVRPPSVEPPAVPTPPTAGTGSNQGTAGDGSGSGGAAQALARKPLYYTVLLGCKDLESDNTDTMMVASYDVPNQKVSLVSIPRDTLVNRTTASGNSYRKINGAYANGGMEEFKAAVSDLLGIPIDYAMVLNIRGFIRLVDELGGVDFYVPCNMNYDDPVQNLHIHYTEGMYYGLTGQQVMEICRYRDDNVDPRTGVRPSGYSNYGIGRDETQRNMMKAIAGKLLSWGSFAKIQSFVELFNENVKTDLSLTDMLWFAEQAYGGFDLGTGLSSGSLPGDSNVTYKGTPYYCTLYPDEALEVINAMLNPYTTDVTRDMVNMFQVG